MQRLSSPRIVLVDVLRGFTLLGIALIHYSDQYYAGANPPSHPNFTSHFLGDDIVMGFLGIFVAGKFFMIFSFLFGLSFFLQSDRTNTGWRFSLRFLWRLTTLLVIGLIHHLHYRGDILTIYAMLGVGLLLANKLPDKFLLMVALVLTLDVPAAVQRGIGSLQAPESTIDDQFKTNDAANEEYYRIVKTGTYAELLKANFYELEFKYRYQVESGRIYITMGLFLLGLYAGRKRFFESLDDYRPWIKRILLKRALWLLLGLILLAAAFFGSVQILKLPMPELSQWAVGGLFYDAANLAMASVYVAGIILLFDEDRWRHRLMIFYEVGRMGLTTYLMQTLFGVLIFFGIGAGLLGEVGALASVGFGLTIFILQIYGSRWWLQKYKYGPAEWLWRSTTYLKRQPFQRQASEIL